MKKIIIAICIILISLSAHADAFLVLRYTGGSANANPNASLGGTLSSVGVASSPMNNVYDNVSASQAVAGGSEYRILGVVNIGDDDAVSPLIYVDPDTSSEDTSLDLACIATTYGLEEGCQSIANEATAPEGVTFDHYTSASKLTLPTIPPNYWVPLCLKWVVDAGAAPTTGDEAIIGLEY